MHVKAPEKDLLAIPIGASLAKINYISLTTKEDERKARQLEAMERLGRLSIDFNGKPMDDRECANARPT